MFFPCLGKYGNVLYVNRATFDSAKHVSHDPLERSNLSGPWELQSRRTPRHQGR